MTIAPTHTGERGTWAVEANSFSKTQYHISISGATRCVKRLNTTFGKVLERMLDTCWDQRWRWRLQLHGVMNIITKLWKYPLSRVKKTDRRPNMFQRQRWRLDIHQWSFVPWLHCLAKPKSYISSEVNFSVQPLLFSSSFLIYSITEVTWYLQCYLQDSSILDLFFIGQIREISLFPLVIWDTPYLFHFSKNYRDTSFFLDVLQLFIDLCRFRFVIWLGQLRTFMLAW